METKVLGLINRIAMSHMGHEHTKHLNDSASRALVTHVIAVFHELEQSEIDELLFSFEGQKSDDHLQVCAKILRNYLNRRWG